MLEQDHRVIGQELDLFHFREEAPGMVFWHPRGLLMYRLLEEAARRVCAAQGYLEVRTPQVLRREVWEASGHWAHFREAMFRLEDQKCEAAIKPVSCPGHILIVKRRVPSYRELPIRLSELGVVHRDEPSGTLHGLMRVRQFTQDDGHVFCREDQAEAEILRFCQAVRPFYAAFGFDDVRVALSTRPADRAGEDAAWDYAEGVLARVLERMGVEPVLQPGAGAFYGPKLEFVLRDRHGRDWQCGTVQLDLGMPKRFDLRYVDSAGERRHPVMIHRALYGSLERFFGMLLEQHGRCLPAWLAPIQAAVLPVSEAQREEAESFRDALARAGLRAELRAEDSLARRVAIAHADAIEHVFVIGAREVEGGSVALRGERGSSSLSREEALRVMSERCRPPELGG